MIVENYWRLKKLSRVFVIPDVHLKPWMFEKAEELVANRKYDAIVMLGDLVDDWNQQENIELYNKTFDAVIEFVKKHPETFWCYGNHDVSYLWQSLETGYSFHAEATVVERIGELRRTLPPENVAFIHRFDNTLFSHAGLTEDFVLRYFENEAANLDYILSTINQMEKNELWQQDSPIWARPQHYEMRLYPEDFFQVVGHTPVNGVLLDGRLLTLDNFSTYRDGQPIGDERFVWIDTENMSWDYAERSL